MYALQSGTAVGNGDGSGEHGRRRRKWWGFFTPPVAGADLRAAWITLSGERDGAVAEAVGLLHSAGGWGRFAHRLDLPERDGAGAEASDAAARGRTPARSRTASSD